MWVCQMIKLLVSEPRFKFSRNIFLTSINWFYHRSCEQFRVDQQSSCSMFSVHAAAGGKIRLMQNIPYSFTGCWKPAKRKTDRGKLKIIRPEISRQVLCRCFSLCGSLVLDPNWGKKKCFIVEVKMCPKPLSELKCNFFH